MALWINKTTLKKVKKSLSDQISSNNFINPPVKYDQNWPKWLSSNINQRESIHNSKQADWTTSIPSGFSTAHKNKVQMSDHGQGPEIWPLLFFLRLCLRFVGQPLRPPFCLFLQHDEQFHLLCEQVSAWLALIFEITSPSQEFPEMLTGDFFLSCIVQLWYLLSNLYPTWVLFTLGLVSLSTLDKLLKQEAWPPVTSCGNLTSSTVAMFCPPHSKQQ